jgi:NADH-quinone oxidoreductase subunit E
MNERCIDLELLDEVKARYPEGEAVHLIHALQDVQEVYNHLPVPAVAVICEHLGVPLAKAFSVATFYKAFSLHPKGDVVIRICAGTACHIRGAQVIVDELVQELAIQPGETTEDLKFSLETVNCVGACAMAPVVTFGDQYYGKVKPGQLVKEVR